RRQRGRSVAISADAVHLACLLITAEQEEPVLLDRAAQVSTELILVENLSRAAGAVPKEIVGVEIGVAEELIRSAMETVRAGLGHHVHVGAGVAAVTGIVGGGLDLEFFECIR